MLRLLNLLENVADRRDADSSLRVAAESARRADALDSMARRSRRIQISALRLKSAQVAPNLSRGIPEWSGRIPDGGRDLPNIAQVRMAMAEVATLISRLSAHAQPGPGSRSAWAAPVGELRWWPRPSSTWPCAEEHVWAMRSNAAMRDAESVWLSGSATHLNAPTANH